MVFYEGWIALQLRTIMADCPTCRCWVLGGTEMRRAGSNWRRCTTPAGNTESLSSLGEFSLWTANLWRCWRPCGQSVTSASGLTSTQSMLLSPTEFAWKSTRIVCSLSVCRDGNVFDFYHLRHSIPSFSFTLKNDFGMANRKLRNSSPTQPDKRSTRRWDFFLFHSPFMHFYVFGRLKNHWRCRCNRSVVTDCVSALI